MKPPANGLPMVEAPTAERPNLLGRFGQRIIDMTTDVFLFTGDLTATLTRGLAPGNWRRTMWTEFERFFYFTGVCAIPAVMLTALLVGLGLVLQIIYWLRVTGQQGSIGDFLVLVLIRELSPIVTALIVIGRSGSVMLDEVGHLTVNGQIRMLESFGIDATDFLAIPRCFASALALFALTTIFLHTALWSGYLAASLAGLTALSLVEFADAVLSRMTLGDHLLLVVKPTLTGFVIGYVAIWHGLRVEASALGVRRALPTAFMYSLLATLLIGIAVSTVL
ncbi:ABC transporter permease [Candidatus Accumulibacter sp. ACC007]|uniref:MlaE family ABC transporter permease n=1 Tax=Candidatus Accumulibacter sp. ACC007 TaxID=2823333 RepID=UPI0025BDB3F3|nr:ABC transporter permease [Candidatus Accumulibacter sp. ACC007]